MESLGELQQRYKVLNKEAEKYNHPEFHDVYKIISQMVIDKDGIGDKGNITLPLKKDEIIDKALKLAGFANDTAFVADFKQYREIEEAAREIQKQMIIHPDYPIKELERKNVEEDSPQPEKIEMCRISLVNARLLAIKLLNQNDALRAFNLIDESFKKEIERTDDNLIGVQIFGEKMRHKIFQQTNDIELLKEQFILTVKKCLQDNYPKIDKSGALLYLDQWAKRGFNKGQQISIEQKGNIIKTAIFLPDELNTAEAKAKFEKAIRAGLCDNNYLWKESIQLLAYFADRVSHYLKLTTKTDKDGNIVTFWKPFEALFQYKGKDEGKSKLKIAKQNWIRLNTRFEPTGYEKVDALFE